MDIIEYLSILIELENNISNLYNLFSEYNDFNFWWNLSIEEKNHASLLKTAIEFYKINKFNINCITDNIYDSIILNKNFNKIIKDFKNNPSRQLSFEIALEIENSAGEIHYQKFMDMDNSDDIVKILHKLNREDDKHYQRIKNYYKDIINSFS